MVFSDQVIEPPITPSVWITEDLDSDPAHRSAESIRVVWKAIKQNASLIHVEAVAVHRIQDGAKSGRTHDIPESVPEGHLDEMRTKIQLDLLDRYEDRNHTLKVRFTQFDISHDIEPLAYKMEGDA